MDANHLTTSPHHSGLGWPHHSWLGLGKYQLIQSNRHKTSSESKSKALLHLNTQCVFKNICIIRVCSFSNKSNFLYLCLSRSLFLSWNTRYVASFPKALKQHVPFQWGYPRLYILWSLSWTVFHVLVLALQPYFFREVLPYWNWFIYLTNWSYIVLAVYSIVEATAVIFVNVCRKEIINGGNEFFFHCFDN